MNYQLHFTVPTFTEEFNVFPIPETENYDYWVLLMRKFIEQSNIIEIQCWNDEKDIIKETTLLFKDSYERVNERNTTHIKGSKTEEITNHLLYKNVKTNGRLKWFSISLSKNEIPLFDSEHWGTEFFVPDISEEDIAYIKSVTPKETNFHQYK
ncbi:hypothetical protein NLX67_21515 [Domibacillus sp. A3M-37]|uniref:hypothetical protein n=1 Tax=Domibacillus sp. A3M-37 TaxID=2962037 RepID=UPI0020B790C0|nr:hypothetical protein [Domibacillus sp. A3M-37]MCP3764898.1 hypothetical protein [Domibacillus sp. A3M-37]